MASDYKIHNDTVFNIIVVMDSNREEHSIVPNGVAIFVRANPLDRPTFHVFVSHPDGSRGPELTAMKVGYWDAISASGEYSFDGKELG